MNCLVNLLALCVFDPSNAYITAEILKPLNSQPFEGRWCRYHNCRGPLTEVRIGMTATLTKGWDLDYGLRHSSFVIDDDRGDESLFLSLTWRPFR